jgi:hypothetical protein
LLVPALPPGPRRLRALLRRARLPRVPADRSSPGHRSYSQPPGDREVALRLAYDLGLRALEVAVEGLEEYGGDPARQVQVLAALANLGEEEARGVTGSFDVDGSALMEAPVLAAIEPFTPSALSRQPVRPAGGYGLEGSLRKGTVQRKRLLRLPVSAQRW